MVFTRTLSAPYSTAAISVMYSIPFFDPAYAAWPADGFCAVNELTEITEIWADTALRLTERDLKLMGRLADKQRRTSSARKVEPA